MRRRELAAQLRTLRTDAGFSVEYVAEQLLCSPSKISRLETAQRRASPRDIRDLCDLYQVSSAQREYLTSLGQESARKAWWQPFDLPYATYVGLESAALVISDFEPGVFPGLLQTPAYARAVHEGAFERLSPEAIDQQIEVRLTRQQILVRDDPPPPRLAAIVDEAVLHRGIGGPDVMAEQIQHVIESVQRDNVEVQVMPYSIGAHPALDSTFILLEIPPPVPDVVYVEGLVGQVYVQRPKEVERYKQIFARLRALSLDSKESAKFLNKILKSYQGM